MHTSKPVDTLNKSYFYVNVLFFLINISILNKTIMFSGFVIA